MIKINFKNNNKINLSFLKNELLKFLEKKKELKFFNSFFF